MARLTAALVALAAALAIAPGAVAGDDRVPLPGTPIPRDAARFAAALTRTDAAVRAAVDDWRLHANPSLGGPPRELELAALYEQRLYIALSRKRALARAVVARLSLRLRARASDIIAARRSLTRLSRPPSRPVRIRTGRPAPAGALLRFYREAERRFGVPWHVLAAVNFVESAFGKVRSASSAGAQGPMQFLPATWRAYGLGGDVHDPRDAILGAANYLRASGAPRNLRRALYAYNHSTLYVDAVLRYARRMRVEPTAFYAFYSWQVYVRTSAGVRRVTGPGLR